MAEQTNATIADVIRENLAGESQEGAVQFITSLNEDGFTPSMWWGNKTCWKIASDGINIAMIQFDPQLWRFTFFFGEYSGDFDDDFTVSVQDHVKFCESCHEACTRGMDAVIFGKPYRNVCSQLSIQFENPNADELKHIKKMMEYCVKHPPNGVSWHAHN